MTASKTTLPVLGVPVQSRALNGMDSLLSIVQMPAGIPVATFAIGSAGATNAALLAAAIVANRHPEVLPRLEAFRATADRTGAGTSGSAHQHAMTVGIVGAGQLGRMMALAGYPLGLDFLFLDPAEAPPAAALAPVLRSEFTDVDSLAALAARCEVVTIDWENVSVAALRALGRETRVSPPPAAIAAAQDRVSEKRLFEKLGIRTTRWRAVSSRRQLARRGARHRPARGHQDPAPGLRRQGPGGGPQLPRIWIGPGPNWARRRCCTRSWCRSTWRCRSSVCAAAMANAGSIRSIATCTPAASCG